MAIDWGTHLRMNDSREPLVAIFHMNMSEFWSGDLGLTLVTISLVALIFVIAPFAKQVFTAAFFSIS
jgi:hypothetical protein